MKRIDLKLPRASTGLDVEIDSMDSIIFGQFSIHRHVTYDVSNVWHLFNLQHQQIGKILLL